MKKIMKLVLLVFSFIFLTQLESVAVDAPSIGSLAVELNIPENQIDKEATYFDLLSPKGSVQELDVKITNMSDEERIIIPSINRAFTNPTGTISYSEKTNDIAPNLTYNIEDLVTIKENKIVLKAKETKILKIYINGPEADYSGILVGALYLLDDTPIEEEGNIKNKFANEIGIVLHGTKDSQTKSETISLKEVEPNQANYKNIVMATFENAEPGFFSKFSLEGVIKKKGSEKDYLVFKEEDLSMAPNSVFNFPVSLNEQPFEAGDYIFKGEVTQGEKKIPFESEFKITEKQAKEFNVKDLSIPKKKWYEDLKTVILIILGILGFIVFIIVVVMFIIKFRKKNSKYKKSTNKKKSTKKRKSSSRSTKSRSK